jgi:opacity protein-like surface antigen
MRCVFRALLLIGLSSPALADDFDVLRGTQSVGPATFTRWSGFYIGGQFGYGNGNADFGTATQSGVGYALRETTLEETLAPSQWQLLGTANTSAINFGGFAGYNTQWQDLIVGVEANFSRANLNLNAPSTPIGPLITAADSQGNTHTVTISAAGSVMNMDFATLRARAGYVAGNFLPYAFIGPAFGLASVSVGANIQDIQCNTTTLVCGTFNFNSAYGRNSEVLYGFTVGGGIDVAVTPNIFVRAEFELDQFDPQPGIPMSIMTGRVGAGLKF